jgi:hypothetical protein
LKGRTAVKRNYHTINKQGKANEKKLTEFLSKGGQLLLPMVDLIEQCQNSLALRPARLLARPKADFVPRLRPGQLPDRAAR